MKIKSLILGAFLASFAGVSAQTVSLPSPQIENGPAILGILAHRQSTNAFDSRALTQQDLANLLWGAMGQNSLRNVDDSFKKIVIVGNPILHFSGARQ